MVYGNSRMGLTIQANRKVMRFMTMLRLDMLDDPRLDAYVRLTDRQLRNRLEPERGILVVESRIAVEVALGEGLVPLSLLVDEVRLAHNQDLVESLGEDCPVFVLGHDEMSRLTGYNVTRGLLCAMRRPRAREVSEVLAGAGNVAVLENLVDITNVGAVFSVCGGARCRCRAPFAKVRRPALSPCGKGLHGDGVSGPVGARR